MLRMLGYARWQILVSFLLESLVIALDRRAGGLRLGTLCNGLSANSMVGSGNGGGKMVVIDAGRGRQHLGRGNVPRRADGRIGGLPRRSPPSACACWMRCDSIEFSVFSK